MHFIPYRVVRLCLLLSLLLTTLLPARPALAQALPESVLADQAGDARSRITVTLGVDQAPTLGAVVTLSLSATPTLAAPDLPWT